MKFPAGGSKDAVFHFLRSHGFVMSAWSDKHWTRSDGLELHVYGVGSKARIYNKNKNLIADDSIEAAIAKAKFLSATCAAIES